MTYYKIVLDDKELYNSPYMRKLQEIVSKKGEPPIKKKVKKEGTNANPNI